MTRSPTAASTPWFATLRRWIGRVFGTGAASLDALELRGMSDHELKDLGIGRSEVQEWSRRRRPTDPLEAPSVDARCSARSMPSPRCSAKWTPALRP